MDVKVDTAELKRFQDKLKNLDAIQTDKFFKDACKGLGGRYLALVIPATPAKTGFLRRGWTGGTDQNSTTYAESLPADRVGFGYTIQITNTAEYASYVENGHRQTPGRYVPAIGKKLKASWVNGKFFQKNSETALAGIAPGFLQALLDAYLARGF